MLRPRRKRRRRAGAVGGAGTTRQALAARLRLGSIRAHRVRIGRGGNGSRRPLPHPPAASGEAWSLTELRGRDTRLEFSRFQPEPDSTPGRETLRNRWRDRRAGDGRHPRQRFLRYEIRARPRVGDDRLSQIGSALAAEIAGVVDLGPELLRRVSSAARLAERHRMIRTQLEEQRSESDEQQHDARIVVLEARASQAGRQNSSVEDVDLVDNSRMAR